MRNETQHPILKAMVFTSPPLGLGYMAAYLKKKHEDFDIKIVDEVTTGLQIDINKMAEVAATFPRPEAELLDQLMTDKGLRPLAKEASASHIGFSHRQLKAMAE